MQILGARVVQVLALAPADDGALGADGQLLVLLRQTGESNVCRWNDLSGQPVFECVSVKVIE